MAKIGTTPNAGRYRDIKSGSHMVYLFEEQSGVPVDGTNASLRNMSPFQVRLIPPLALLEMLAESDTFITAVDAVTAGAMSAAFGGLANQQATTLNTVTVLNTTTSQQMAVEPYVAGGEHSNSGNPAFQSGLVDRNTAADIALQLQAIQNAEPLVLLVNPAEMSVTHTKIQSYQSRTRTGFVFEAWGEDQPTISFSGSTAGFVAGAIGQPPSLTGLIPESESVAGYQFAARRDSAAWQNFAALYQFYRNNGYIYDISGHSDAHLFVGSMAIDYDQITYEGHIESFSFKFDEGMPHRVEFDMEFKVSRMYDNALSSSFVQPQSSSPTATAQGLSLDGGIQTDGVSGTPEMSETPLDPYASGLVFA